MHPSLQREIPEFLYDSIVYCDSLTYKKNERSCFLLTKYLKFYEFRKKQLLHSIDLSKTCFTKLKERIMTYDGRKCKWLGDVLENGSVSTQAESMAAKRSKVNLQQTQTKLDIKFGKYIYMNFDASKMYLLLVCWDSLVILQRLFGATTENLRFVAEYENVVNFKIIPSTMIKHQAVVKIQFGDGKHILTNFEEGDVTENAISPANTLQQKGEFKQLLERVRQAKAELQFHKEITHKQFTRLKNKQSFGCGVLRSTKLEEKLLLARCGDVWMRFTSGDELVLGLPLVNNSAPANLTTLRNLQPIININGSVPSINYKYRVYQLQQAFENLETLESFFQTEDAQLNLNTWTATEAHILPASFVVLLLEFRLSQLVLIEEKCQLFVRFQIEKDLEIGASEVHTFEQHLFIKTIDFQEILLQRQENEISFNEKTLHQDFLALAMTGFHTKLQIDFATNTDRNKFEQLLALQFDFEIVHREAAQIFDDNTSMDVDDNTPEFKHLPYTLFYNRKPSSLWFGAIIMRATDSQTFNDFDSCRTVWTFYNKNEEKAFLMFKFLFNELLAHKCNVIDIKHELECQGNDSKIINFENAMRQELATFLDIASNEYNNDKLIEKMNLLTGLQYNTDILAAGQCQDVK